MDVMLYYLHYYNVHIEMAAGCLINLQLKDNIAKLPLCARYFFLQAKYLALF